MPRSPHQLREDALAIWQAGVEAVRSDRLVSEHVRVDGETLHIGDDEIDLRDVGRVIVVGAGKAGAGMAAGLEEALRSLIADGARPLQGWVNVPEDCVRSLLHIHLHAARPAGVNEPTPEGVRGTQEILRLVESATPRDLCVFLISGGGSALLPAPIDGITLQDKQRVTRFLSGAGANIHELNTVRKQLSRVKGGALARACRAGWLYTLVISDVLGDPLDVIASGPTVENAATPREALCILERFDPQHRHAPSSIWNALVERAASAPHPQEEGDWNNPKSQIPNSKSQLPNLKSEIRNLKSRIDVIGNNALAVDAAGQEAVRRGYSPAMHAATKLEGAAEEIGRHLADMALRMRDHAGPDCLITGGEPTVQLADESIRGKGGRNQQLVLAALVHLLQHSGQPLRGIALLSGGTDGEDGPTDAAGAVIDADVLARMQQLVLDPADFLRRNDAYHFFAPLGVLIKTGPTHTNVCDVRVVVVDRQ
jgi:hydroxypyruvate reductase